jgi:hypothetical protein
MDWMKATGKRGNQSHLEIAIHIVVMVVTAIVAVIAAVVVAEVEAVVIIIKVEACNKSQTMAKTLTAIQMQVETLVLAIQNLLSHHYFD